MYKNPIIKTFYNSKQVLEKDNLKNFSKSPLKPKLLLEFLKKNNLLDFFEIVDDFVPFEREDFYIAHYKSYVDSMFEGEKPFCESNGLKWSKQFLESLTYTNASLYYAIRESILEPKQITFSNTSGFHHATPEKGRAFCSFSGQVIASIEVHYIVFAHGADSHIDDDLGGQLTTEQWIQCSKIVYKWIRQLEIKLKKTIPLTLTLFGGYRRDHFESVLSLHTTDLVVCLNSLCGTNLIYKSNVQSRINK